LDDRGPLVLLCRRHGRGVGPAGRGRPDGRQRAAGPPRGHGRRGRGRRGRPEGFPHMLRLFKPTSPMSMGSWVLAGLGPSAVNAAVSEWFGIFPRLGRVAEVVSGLLGPALATYTAVLVANTAVPVWHEAGRELPLVFAGSARARAGAATPLLTPAADAGPAPPLAVPAAVVELAAGQVMEHGLGELAEPYHQGV